MNEPEYKYGERRYFAIVDGRHNKKNPRAIMDVTIGRKSDLILEPDGDVIWTPSNLLHQIEAGEVPYRAEWITTKAAARIRERWEKRIDFRYFIIARKEDPHDHPIGVIRERVIAGTRLGHTERYSRKDGWVSDGMRVELERASDPWARIVPSDSASAQQVIDSLHRR